MTVFYYYYITTECFWYHGYVHCTLLLQLHHIQQVYVEVAELYTTTD